MALKTIGSLWVGGELSWLEQLCLTSFLHHGHEVVLYSYEDVAGVPDGVRCEDANTILPADNIIRHARTGSPAYHADVFRLHMLKQTDYIWADTDAYCCQPWTPKGKHFHGWVTNELELVNNGVLGLPKSSKTLAQMISFTSDEHPVPPWYSAETKARLQAEKDRGDGVHVSLLPWGVWGPDALTWFLKETGEIKHSLADHVLYPLSFKKGGYTLHANRKADVESMIHDDTLSIHFWGRRFRNVAAKYGGVPPANSYAAALLEKHSIDPTKTSHLMAKKKEKTIRSPNDLDFSMFTDADVANLVLQRSEIAKDVGQGVRNWMAGDSAELLEYAAANRDRLLRDGFEAASLECDIFFGAVDEINPKRIADIGCGYAFADLHLHDRYECEIVLIDIESGNDRHFGFNNTHPGYTSLTKAREFLEKNGVPPNDITTLNPTKDDVEEAGSFDLILSLLSCGFHYPVDTYDAMFRSQVNSGGGVLLDIRKGSGGIGAMKTFGAVDVLAKQNKHSKVLSLNTG